MSDKTKSCQGCGKSQTDVNRLVELASTLEGTPIYICNECIELLDEIIKAGE